MIIEVGLSNPVGRHQLMEPQAHPLELVVQCQEVANVKLLAF